MSEMTLDSRPPQTPVPGYLGRILNDNETPVGTCFQASPGWLVTAWHVLRAGATGAQVLVDPLTGGGAFTGTVKAVDEVHDLALIRAQQALPASVAGWARTDGQPPGTKMVITGAPDVADRHTYRFLDTRGTCEGSALRDDHVSLGRVEATAVLPGMSGAPVRRACDDRVIGVLSARYNSPDTWLRNTLWIARTEDLARLLANVQGLPPGALPRNDIEWILQSEADDGEEALQVAEDIRTWLPVEVPDGHHILIGRTNHAECVGTAGKPLKAARLYAEMIDDVQRVRGAEDPLSFIVRSQHAGWLGQAGYAAEAAWLYECLLPDFIRIHGTELPVEVRAARKRQPRVFSRECELTARQQKGASHLR